MQVMLALSEFLLLQDTIIADILKINPNAESILMSAGMHCLGCPASQGETLQEACMVHGLDIEELLKKLK